jgi:hypothetical protein
MYRKGSRVDDSDDEKRTFTTTNRIHAKYDKSSGEANTKVRLERAVRTDVMYVCTTPKETRQHRAPWRTHTEDVLEHTLLHLQALVLPQNEPS